MSRRGDKRLDAVDGVLLLNKPAGITSNRVLQRVRKLLKARKAGHTGSLDPAATGMLPLCFGEATKVAAFLLDADKTYRVTASLGTATDTGDADGARTDSRPVPERSAPEWTQTLEGFLGESSQVPPMYSALKHEGKRLYELARKGQTVDREPRAIHIRTIELLEARGSRLVFRVCCSKGTYVRTLVEDIAAAAGTVAHTARLHRESVGEFRPADMLDMAEVEAAAADDLEALRRGLLPADAALSGMPGVVLDAADGLRFVRGQAVTMAEAGPPGLIRVHGAAERFLGVGLLAGDGRLVPRRVFHAGE